MTRRTAYTVLFSVIAIYGAFVLRGPQGIPALFEKHRQIRQLEEQNATTALENKRRRERIQRLETSTTEQEMEIRKQLKLLRPGETTFILPEGAKDKPSEDDTKP
ncbi:MAG: septum formation initiator family protein [Bryobacteraceae bacterium]